MAKKKEEKLTLLQMPLPSDRKYSKLTRNGWAGVNKVDVIDSGELSDCLNITTRELPILTSAKSPSLFKDYENPISMFSFGEYLLVIYRENDRILMDYFKPRSGPVHTGIIKASGATSEDEYPRSVVQYNVFDNPTNPASGEFVKKLLIFPDLYSFDINFEYAKSNPFLWTKEELEKANKGKVYYYDGLYYEYKSLTFKYYTDLSVFGSTEKFFLPKGVYFYEEGISDNVTDGRLVADYKIGHYLIGTGLGSRYYYQPESIKIYEGINREWVAYSTNKWEYPLDALTVATKACTATRLPTSGVGNLNPTYWYYDDEQGSYWSYNGAKWTGGGLIPPAFPPIKYATVYQSRLYGVAEGMVYVSGFNDYANWMLDTAAGTHASGAWCSPSQSNTKAGGDFTGITTFQERVICFKKDFMHEIYNTKNPFRICDIFAEGSIDNRTLQEIDGNLFFVSEDGLKVYTGGNPKTVSTELNITKYKDVVSGSDGRNYYLFYDSGNNPKIFVFDTYNGRWAIRKSPKNVKSFASIEDRVYLLADDNTEQSEGTGVYLLNGRADEWWFETDFITNKTVDIKRIRKIQLLAEQVENISNEPTKIYILYDNEPFDEAKSHLAYEWSHENKEFGMVVLRFKPRKTACFGFKLHITGIEVDKFYGLEIFAEDGGDLYGKI